MWLHQRDKAQACENEINGQKACENKTVGALGIGEDIFRGQKDFLELEMILGWFRILGIRLWELHMERSEAYHVGLIDDKDVAVWLCEYCGYAWFPGNFIFSTIGFCPSYTSYMMKFTRH